MKTNLFKTKRAAGFILMFWLAVAAHGMGQDFAGIGIALIKENGNFVVKQVLPGGPAASSGQINVNDRIIAIAQEGQSSVKTEGLELTEVTRMIRGTKGTSLRLTIVPGRGENAESQVISLVRDDIKTLAAAASAADEFKPGKAAPEIEGEDMDGKIFKLSDYRGKVVLLDFWGDW